VTPGQTALHCGTPTELACVNGTCTSTADEPPFEYEIAPNTPALVD
jgi:hypothetical protein